jgi:Icc protein
VIQYGQVPPPTHVLAHVSDTHLLAGNARQYDAIDTAARFAAALDRLSRMDPPPQALVITGDLADLGEPEAYRLLRSMVAPVAEQMGAQVVWCMGNHDERAAYSRELFGTESDDPQDRVHDVAGLRVVSLDTSVPGWHHGELTDAQLAWLRDVLSTPAEHGTVLALHHPPIPSPMLPVAEVIELLHTDRLAEVVRGSDVRVILGGHYHSRRTRPSPASRSRSPRPPATCRTRRGATASSPPSTATPRSTPCTSTPTGWCTRSCPCRRRPR